MYPSVALDYFSVVPPVHQPFETDNDSPYYSPVFTSPSGEIAADCDQPLLAHRKPSPLQLQSTTTTTTTTMSSKILQLQTTAAHQSTNRPQPVPMQNMLHVTGNYSSGSDSSPGSSYSSPLSSLPEMARCSRCQRTPSIDIKSGKSNMLQYGLNLWYCSRCAALVGWSKG